MAETIKIAASEEGKTLVSFGNPQMISIVSNTRPSIAKSAFPCIHCRFPAVSVTLNCDSCDMKIMIARPFTKPNITGCGTSLINFPSLRKPTINCIIPARITVAKIYSTPWLRESATNTTATAPVAPEIIPGLPPNTAVISPIMKAAYKPVSGERPAMNAKAIASGISARATVSPESISVL